MVLLIRSLRISALFLLFSTTDEFLSVYYLDFSRFYLSNWRTTSVRVVKVERISYRAAFLAVLAILESIYLWREWLMSDTSLKERK